MIRTDLINRLAKLIKATSYFEIGVADGHNMAAVDCPIKFGVDPDVNAKSATHQMTSDEFFASSLTTFDLIFVDGLHHCEQVYRDIFNAISRLNPGGFVVCHDMNPLTQRMQAVPMETPEWTGDCWKAWVTIRTQRSDLAMFVVDTDYGCGIIQRGSQECLNINGLCLDWDNLCQHRTEWLNLITVQEFVRWLTTCKPLNESTQIR